MWQRMNYEGKQRKKRNYIRGKVNHSSMIKLEHKEDQKVRNEGNQQEPHVAAKAIQRNRKETKKLIHPLMVGLVVNDPLKNKQMHYIESETKAKGKVRAVRHPL